MKVDIGFWDKNGEYKEDIQEVEMLSVKDLNEIELIKAQNEGLKKQNKELQEEIKKYSAINEQETKDYAELKAENERLKALCDTYRTCYQAKHSDVKCLLPKYKQTLQEIKEIAEFHITDDDCEDVQNDMEQIIDLITKAEEE